MKKLIFVLLIALCAQTAYSQKAKDSTNILNVGEEMPDFTLKGIDGQTLTSDDLYGKVVLINFFATWCGPCNLELPEVYKDIWTKYRSNKNFVLVIASREEKPEVVQAFVKKKKWDMPFYLDEKKEVYTKFATKFIPRNYLFDKESKLVLNSMSYNKEDFEILKKEIAGLLK